MVPDRVTGAGGDMRVPPIHVGCPQAMVPLGLQKSHSLPPFYRYIVMANIPAHDQVPNNTSESPN